jgi:hypothetical protein
MARYPSSFSIFHPPGFGRLFQRGEGLLPSAEEGLQGGDVVEGVRVGGLQGPELLGELERLRVVTLLPGPVKLVLGLFELRRGLVDGEGEARQGDQGRGQEQEQRA